MRHCLCCILLERSVLTLSLYFSNWTCTKEGNIFVIPYLPSAISSPKITALHPTILKQWISWAPLRLVLIKAVVTLNLASPSQRKTYSGWVSINRAITSPVLKPWRLKYQAMRLLSSSPCDLERDFVLEICTILWLTSDFFYSLIWMTFVF